MEDVIPLEGAVAEIMRRYNCGTRGARHRLMALYNQGRVKDRKVFLKKAHENFV